MISRLKSEQIKHGKDRQMRGILLKILFLFVLLVTGGFVFQSKAQAAVHNIRLYDDEMETNWESDGDNEDIDENDLYLPGDTGKISLLRFPREDTDSHYLLGKPI